MMTITFVKEQPSVVHRNRRNFSGKFKQAFVSFCAYKGYFDGTFNKEQIRLAKKGRLPEGLTVHHITPLGGGGQNDFNNLTVISESFHKFLNKNFFDRQLKGINDEPVGFTKELKVPYLPTVALKKEREIVEFMRLINRRGNEI
ncbi:MAG: HNH endonuclease [Clostridium sp.]|nr:HNH endonuclease [Clostridium sp.]